jgi:hypothetical protein
MTEPSFKCMRCGELDSHQPECELETFRGRCKGASNMLDKAQPHIMLCMENMGGGYTQREVRLLKIIMNTNAILAGTKPLFSLGGQ